MTGIPVPDEPLKVALIGAGNRASVIYGPLLPDVSPWLEIVAVCDPVDEHRQSLANTPGVPDYADLHDLVADRPMEAAIIVTPVTSHYAINMFLIDHGIHCHCERFAQTVRDSGYLGDIKRVVTYNAHTGYHNNSRWTVLFGSPRNSSRRLLLGEAMLAISYPQP